MTIDLFGDTPPPTSERDPLDRYYTPEWATQALVDYLGERLTGGVWDPCCGGDWGGRVIRKAPHVVRYLGTDIDPDATSRIVGQWGNETIDHRLHDEFDFLDTAIGWGIGYDQPADNRCNWIITNPPYQLANATAADFVRHALTGSASVAMLLRLTWLEPCRDRVDILTLNPPTDLLILPRVHYINAANSNPCTSVWVIWDRNATGSRVSWHQKTETTP